MQLKVLILVASCVLLPAANCQLIDTSMSTPELVECAQLLGNNTGNSGIVYETNQEIYVHCLQQFLWKDLNIYWSELNITESDKGFVNSLVTSFARRGRSKRNVKKQGPGGPGVRREYRMLSDQERMQFHRALNQMKKSGQYDIFAKMHKGIVLQTAHFGPNFLGWHRVFLAVFEEALRRYAPWISVPYWDSTLDYYMKKPADSIIWTSAFLGNGNGLVVTGPFAKWTAMPGGKLTRNINRGSTLFTNEMVMTFLSRCRMSEVTYPTAKAKYNIERYHSGPHIWIGGHMSGMNTAAYDPAFYLLHAYIDYLWEIFRHRQATVCGVNPSTDYPPSKGAQSPKRPMDGLQQYKGIDGISNYWTNVRYRYERSPTCSTWRPFCGSPYLRCDISRKRCVSMPRRKPHPVVGKRVPIGAYGGRLSPIEAASRNQAFRLNYGELFTAPAAEPRTQDARLGMPFGNMAGRVGYGNRGKKG